MISARFSPYGGMKAQQGWLNVHLKISLDYSVIILLPGETM